MKIRHITFFFCISLLSQNTYSKTIVVVNIQELIDSNLFYNNIIKEIEINQEEYLKNFEIKEKELKSTLNEIEESKLILNDNEINIKIDNYNKKISDFSILIEEFNFHYQNEIIKIRESILKEILKLLEKYAIDNNVDLILDSNSYLIASNSIDITNEISIELEKINLILEYKSFEKN